MRLMWNKVVHHTKERICKLLFLANDHFWTTDQQEPVGITEPKRKRFLFVRSFPIHRTLSSQPLLEENTHGLVGHGLDNFTGSVSSEKSIHNEISSINDSSHVVRLKMHKKSKNVGRFQLRSKRPVIIHRSRTFVHRETLQKSKRCIQSPFCLAAYHQRWDDFELFMEIGSDVNQAQTYVFDQSTSKTVCLRFNSVIDLLLYYIQKKSMSDSKIKESLSMNSQHKSAVFPQLLTMLLNKGADIRLRTTLENDDPGGGIHINRLCEIFQLAGRQFSKTFSSERYLIDKDHQVDAAGIIRQLLQSGLDVPLCPKHVSNSVTTHNFVQDLYTVLLQGLEKRHSNSSSSRLPASLQSFVILWLNVVYSSSTCDHRCYSTLHQSKQNGYMLAYHHVFQQFCQPPRLFVLARRVVRQLIGTRWFFKTVTNSATTTCSNKNNVFDFGCIKRSQAVRVWLSPLSETLRRAIAYLDAHDIRKELESVQIGDEIGDSYESSIEE
ncbi:hypothetical protein FGIG_02808 [Fasciola gigantica]|uniref:Uncharacterized protein n=1 Tax=Fasciola gigantica TaxID=46835 RepID=A0A504YFV6_FASGI|nr:hypothetical protein FGIG_02808 [Fasciola gigantica]